MNQCEQKRSRTANEPLAQESAELRSKRKKLSGRSQKERDGGQDAHRAAARALPVMCTTCGSAPRRIGAYSKFAPDRTDFAFFKPSTSFSRASLRMSKFSRMKSHLACNSKRYCLILERSASSDVFFSLVATMLESKSAFAASLVVMDSTIVSREAWESDIKRS